MKQIRKTLKKKARQTRAKALLALDTGDWRTYIRLSRQALALDDRVMESYGR